MSAWAQLVGRLTSPPQRRAFAGGGHYWLFFVETCRPTSPDRTDTWTCTWTGDAAERAKDLMAGQWVAVTGYLETYEKALGKQTVNFTAVRVLDVRPLKIRDQDGNGDRAVGQVGPSQPKENSTQVPLVANAEGRVTVTEKPRGTGTDEVAGQWQEPAPSRDRKTSPVPSSPIPMVKVDPSMFGLADDEEDESRA